MMNRQAIDALDPLYEKLVRAVAQALCDVSRTERAQALDYFARGIKQKIWSFLREADEHEREVNAWLNHRRLHTGANPPPNMGDE
jgi:hypothetical protein